MTQIAGQSAIRGVNNPVHRNNGVVTTNWNYTFDGVKALCKRGPRYEIWIESFPSGTAESRVGHLVSSDGIQWTEDCANPVLVQSQAWETVTSGVAIKTVLHDDGLFKAWYHCANAGIGYATSPDGINWTKYANNPVIALASQSWHNSIIAEPSVVKLNGSYYMYYSGQVSSGPPKGGVATSPDGINWTEYAGNPVLTPNGTTEDNIAWGSINYAAGLWHCFYGYGIGIAGFGQDRMGYAYSSDFFTWTHGANNPLLVTLGVSPEAFAIPGTLSAFADGPQFRVYYESLNQFSGPREDWTCLAFASRPNDDKRGGALRTGSIRPTSGQARVR